MANVNWNFDAIEILTCNCDWGCPCQFNAMPTHGDCRASGAFRIEKGQFGETSLDGVTFAFLAAWPGAIHQGNGQAQLIIDESTNEAQRKAVEAIFRGEETEPGGTIFNVFSNVIDTYHDTIVAPIQFEADIEARTAKFSVPGIVEAQGEPIKNPVTGMAHRARVTIPHGFEYHEAEYGSSTVKTRDKATIPLEWAAGHAHFTRTSWSTQGVAHP